MNTKQALSTLSLTGNGIIIDTYDEHITIARLDTPNVNSPLCDPNSAKVKDNNSFLMILVLGGHAEITLNYKPYTLTPNNLALIVPGQTNQITQMSSDFKAWFVVVEKTLLEDISRERKDAFNYFSLKRNPIISLNPQEKTNLEKAILQLCEKIRLQTHLYKKDVVQNTTSGLFLELLNILASKDDDFVYPVLSRAEEIVDQFLKLLSQHGKEQHPLSFYANKLFITPQYLSLTLKEQTGKTGSKWLNEALILEAKRLIKSPYSTIQDVAYTLNFSDQSTFGKFFKKSLGMSPLVYRRIS